MDEDDLENEGIQGDEDREKTTYEY